MGVLDAADADVVRAYKEQLAPAIDRVWRDELAVIARDLRGWLRRTTEDEGLDPALLRAVIRPAAGGEERDPRSRREDTVLD